MQVFPTDQRVSQIIAAYSAILARKRRRRNWSGREVVVHLGAGNGIQRLAPPFCSVFAYPLARRVRHVG